MAERLRVMRVIARMNVGGPALQVTSLVEGLDPERFDQRLYTGAVGEDEADHISLRAPHLPVSRIDGLGRAARPLDDVRALLSLWREVRRFRPHVIHTHTAKAGVLGRLAAIAGRTPVTVHTFHGHLLHGYFSPLVTRAVVLVERVLARRTTRLVAVGDAVRRDLLAARIGRPEQYLVVPPGIRVAAPPSRADARASLGVPSDAQVVAFVGRITGVKRPDRFVEVARAVASERPGTWFVVCGDGDLGEETRASLEGLDHTWLGWRADVETIYAASDLALLTSDNEGMPVALIEAATCGVPAVSTDVGSVREVVLDGVTGHVVDVSTDALLDAVLDLLDDEERRAGMGEAARAHATTRFGPARLVTDMDELYSSLAAGLVRPTPAA